MFRLLSERITQKEAGWTKPLCHTAMGFQLILQFKAKSAETALAGVCDLFG
jgi:hypothetical protein